MRRDDKVEFYKSITQYAQAQLNSDNMKRDIFSWGANGPYDKNDYTKKKAEISNKIKKMHRCFVSESRDNYRNHFVHSPFGNADNGENLCTVGVCVRCKQPGNFCRFLMGEMEDGVKFETHNLGAGPQTFGKMEYK